MEAIHIYSLHRQAAGRSTTRKPMGIEPTSGNALLGLEYVADQVNNTVAVAPLVVVPGDKLDEVLVQSDSSLGVKDARPAVTSEVGGNQILLCVSHNTLERPLRRGPVKPKQLCQ